MLPSEVTVSNTQQMGSQQSTSISHPSPPTKENSGLKSKKDVDTPPPPTTTINNNDEESPSNPKRKKKIPPNLHGFKLVEYKCRKKKRAYDLCHSTKHKSFVAGRKYQDEDGDEQSCEELFDIYKECIFRGMMKDREKRGLRPPTEESALGGYAEYADDE